MHNPIHVIVNRRNCADMIDRIISELLIREGENFTDHPNDRGGPTKWGITQATWSEYIGREASVVEIQALTRQDAEGFYRRKYVLDSRFYMIEDDHLMELVVDAAVNHGIHRATRWLQIAANAAPDGVFGRDTTKAVNSADALELFLWVLAYRVRLYGRLVRADHTQAVFIAGWNNRIAGFLEAAAGRLEDKHNGR